MMTSEIILLTSADPGKMSFFGVQNPFSTQVGRLIGESRVKLLKIYIFSFIAHLYASMLIF